ncbi:hypothetical protein NW754_008029 [Fusarium falciforme]|nr:hypothetical protein NW754_008029 [Fusarium falciforme]
MPTTPRYQEGLFSPRQLIFTPHQVLFHCTEGQQSEIFTEPISWQVDKPLCVRDLSVWNHVKAFSKRDLSYHHDVLDAIKATMSTYTRGSGGQAEFLWEVPFAESPHPLDSSEVRTHASRLSEDPIESASQVFCYGLAWKASRRNPEAIAKASQRLILVKVDDPERPSSDVYERVGYVHDLYVERIPRVDREATRQVQTIPNPSMRWAIEEVRQLELERERQRAEAVERCRAAKAKRLREGTERLQEKASQTWDGFWTYSLRPHGVGTNARSSLESTTQGKVVEDLLNEKEESLGEGNEEALDENEDIFDEDEDFLDFLRKAHAATLDAVKWKTLDKQEVLGEGKDKNSERLDESTFEVISKADANSPERSSLGIDFDAGDDTDCDCDSTSTDSYDMGEKGRSFGIKQIDAWKVEKRVFK